MIIYIYIYDYICIYIYDYIYTHILTHYIISMIHPSGTAESGSAADARRVVSRLLVQSGQAPEAPNRRAAMEALQLGRCRWCPRRSVKVRLSNT